jgi:hypothetical protein
MKVKRVSGFLSAAFAAGVLSVAALPAHGGFYLQEEIKPMWFKIDLNGDGYISKDELCAEDPGLVRGFSKADYNGDGKLELREFEILLISL